MIFTTNVLYVLVIDNTSDPFVFTFSKMTFSPFVHIKNNSIRLLKKYQAEISSEFH